MSNEVSFWCVSSNWHISPQLQNILSHLFPVSVFSSVEQSWASWMPYYRWQRPAGTALSWRCGPASWRDVAGQCFPCCPVCKAGPLRYRPLHLWGTCQLCWPLAFMCTNDWSTTMQGWKIQILLQPKCKERFYACVSGCVVECYGTRFEWDIGCCALMYLLALQHSLYICPSQNHSGIQWIKYRNCYCLLSASWDFNK